VKVRAYNARGTGQYSEINTDGALIEEVPTNLTVVSIDIPSTTNTQTKVTWPALTGSARGGKNVAIITYEVFFEDTSATTPAWTSLGNDTLLNLYYVKTGLTGGVTYSFKVRAYNKYGAGDYTAPVSVQTS
jgi:hypothetical protein